MSEDQTALQKSNPDLPLEQTGGKFLLDKFCGVSCPMNSLGYCSPTPNFNHLHTFNKRHENGHSSKRKESERARLIRSLTWEQ